MVFFFSSAWFEDKKCDFTVIHKFQGSLFQSKQKQSCFNVVAWHGNYAPFKYDLRKFVVINSVSVDHIVRFKKLMKNREITFI